MVGEESWAPVPAGVFAWVGAQSLRGALPGLSQRVGELHSAYLRAASAVVAARATLERARSEHAEQSEASGQRIGRLESEVRGSAGS